MESSDLENVGKDKKPNYKYINPAIYKQFW